MVKCNRVDGDDEGHGGGQTENEKRRKKNARSLEGLFDRLFPLAIRLAVRGSIPASRVSFSLLGEVDLGERVWFLREDLVEAFLERRRRPLRTLFERGRRELEGD